MDYDYDVSYKKITPFFMTYEVRGVEDEIYYKGHVFGLPSKLRDKLCDAVCYGILLNETLKYVQGVRETKVHSLAVYENGVELCHFSSYNGF